MFKALLTSVQRLGRDPLLGLLCLYENEIKTQLALCACVRFGRLVSVDYHRTAMFEDERSWRCVSFVYDGECKGFYYSGFLYDNE